MAAFTTIALMGLGLAGGAMAYSSSRTQAKRAEAQADIASRQGAVELRRSAQSVEEAMRELEDAREYQQWKEQYVAPVLQKGIEDPRQSDPAQLRAGQNLGRGMQVEQAQDVVAQGITGAGFDFGGSRMAAASEELTGARAASDVAGMAATHEQVKQQGIANTGSLIQSGRAVYKQQGII